MIYYTQRDQQVLDVLEVRASHAYYCFKTAIENPVLNSGYTLDPTSVYTMFNFEKTNIESEYPFSDIDQKLTMALIIGPAIYELEKHDLEEIFQNAADFRKKNIINGLLETKEELLQIKSNPSLENKQYSQEALLITGYFTLPAAQEALKNLSNKKGNEQDVATLKNFSNLTSNFLDRSTMHRGSRAGFNQTIGSRIPGVLKKPWNRKFKS